MELRFDEIVLLNFIYDGCVLGLYNGLYSRFYVLFRLKIELHTILVIFRYRRIGRKRFKLIENKPLIYCHPNVLLNICDRRQFFDLEYVISANYVC